MQQEESSHLVERGPEGGMSQGQHRRYCGRSTGVWIGWASVLKSFSERAQNFVEGDLWGKEDDSKLEQRLKPRSDLGEKVKRSGW